MGDSASGNITKINNVLNGFESRIERAEGDLKDCANQVRLAQEQLEKPFEQENELNEKSARLAQLNLELNINNHSGEADEEDELTLSEDEEYDYRNELAESGIDESELFGDSRRGDDSEEVAANVGQELSEQGQDDELVREIESGAMFDIEGTFVKAKESSGAFDDYEREETANLTPIDSFTDTPDKPAGKSITSAELYGGKTNLENYRDFHYPKAAQFIDIHDPSGQYASLVDDGDVRDYRILVEGIVKEVMEEHKIAERPLNPRNFNEEYHFIRDCAMSVVCRELEMPDFPAPPASKNFSGGEIWQMREMGYRTAELALYGHLPEKEREKLLAEMKSEGDKTDISTIDPTEERKALIAEARRKLAEDGAMPIITDAIEGRAYSGEIVEIGSTYAVQKIDEGRGIIHNLRYLKDFTRVLNESSKVPYLEITYDREMNGSVGKNEAAELGRAAAVGR
jgi:hypothetical protein